MTHYVELTTEELSCLYWALKYREKPDHPLLLKLERLLWR